VEEATKAGVGTGPKISSTGWPAAHTLARYRCFLPDLAGLAGLRRAGPGTPTMIPPKTGGRMWKTNGNRFHRS